jgi:transcriptional/translational regulatory protein YebC/TACO1
VYGEDLKFNPQLANTIALATKASVPKALIENAIARGQGRSTTGAQLESLTFEIIVAPNIAIIAEAETDSKIRTLAEMRATIKKAGGLSSASAFYFTKRGRAIFKSKEGEPTLSEIIEEAIEHDGAEDVEELPEGGFMVWTQPPSLMAITEAFSTKFNLEIAESDIIWAPNEDTVVGLDAPETAETIGNLLSAVKDYPEVKAIYSNLRQGNIADEEWDKVARSLDM